MLYLGLGPDEAYEEYLDDSATRRGTLSSGEFLEERAAAETAPLQARASALGGSSLRPLAPETTGTVRTIQPAVASKPYEVAPTSYKDPLLKEMADRFLADQPIIINFQGVEEVEAKRIIDFASGICYGRGGAMKKVAIQVFLLTPRDVEVSVDDLKRFEQDDLDLY